MFFLVTEMRICPSSETSGVVGYSGVVKNGSQKEAAQKLELVRWGNNTRWKDGFFFRERDLEEYRKEKNKILPAFLLSEVKELTDPI